MTSRAPIFYSVSAQHDNLGDIEIRRIVLGWLRQLGRPVVVFTGPMSHAYVDALGEVQGLDLYSDSIAFEKKLVSAALRGGASLVFAPGPQVFGSPRLAVRTTLNLVNVTLIAARGGRSVAIGRSLRGGRSLGRSLDRLFIKRLSYFGVRDDVSASHVGLVLQKAPDVAFEVVDTAAVAGRRDLVALSFRSDTDAPESSINALVCAIREQGFAPVFVSQVQRDDARHSLLSKTYDARAELWGTRTHREQEQAVRTVYRRSRYVVSDRLHALIMGMQCGALPVSPSFVTSDKATSTLRGVVSLESWPPERGATWFGGDSVMAAERLDLELARAREDLSHVRDHVLQLLSE